MIGDREGRGEADVEAGGGRVWPPSPLRHFDFIPVMLESQTQKINSAVLDYRECRHLFHKSQETGTGKRTHSPPVHPLQRVSIFGVSFRLPPGDLGLA